MTFNAPDSLAGQIVQHIAERIIRGELKPGERVQEMKVSQALNVSRGSVREALLILQRRHLVEILPRCGARVAVLDVQQVSGLYDLIIELYVLLANGVAARWRDESEIESLMEIQQSLRDAQQRDDVLGFLKHSFEAMRAAYPFVQNPYLQEAVENLQPAISRTYFLALEQRRSQMDVFLEAFVDLQKAIVARDCTWIRNILQGYCEQNRQLVLAALQAR